MTIENHPWINYIRPSEEDIIALVTKHGLNETMVRDALDRNEIPHFTTEDDITYIITRFSHKSKRGAIDTAPILFALSKDKLITISLEEIPTFVDVTASPNGTPIKDPALVMLRILLNIDAQYDIFIHEISKKIRTLRKNIAKRYVDIDTFLKYVHIEDDLQDFISSLEPTNASLKHLRSNGSIAGFTKHSVLIDTVILNNEQSMKVCESNLKSLESIRRTHTLVNSYRLDRTIKILTLASVFISIPTMLFSMYGMNIKLPGMDSDGAFIAIMIACLFLAAAAYTVGRRKRIF